jgi:hypothetical protein
LKRAGAPVTSPRAFVPPISAPDTLVDIGVERSSLVRWGTARVTPANRRLVARRRATIAMAGAFAGECRRGGALWRRHEIHGTGTRLRGTGGARAIRSRCARRPQTRRLGRDAERRRDVPPG